MPEWSPNKCTFCGGDGDVDGEVCINCLGTGMVSTIGRNMAVLNIAAQCEALITKANDIIAEQASQRADLTAALTQIWNKVKDL